MAFQFSKDTSNQTPTTVRAKRSGWQARLELATTRSTSECLDHFGFDHHGGSGTNRTPVARFGDALVAHDAGPREMRRDRLCADPLVVRTGVSEQELRCGGTFDWARADRPERIIAQAIQIHGPRPVALDRKSIGCVLLHHNVSNPKRLPLYLSSTRTMFLTLTSFSDVTPSSSRCHAELVEV